MVSVPSGFFHLLLLIRKRMEILKKRIMNLSQSQHESPFHWKWWKRRKEKAAWSWKEQSKSLFAGEQRWTKQGESEDRHHCLSNTSGIKQCQCLSPYNTHLATLLPLALGTDTALHMCFSADSALLTDPVGTWGKGDKDKQLKLVIVHLKLWFSIHLQGKKEYTVG